MKITAWAISALTTVFAASAASSVSLRGLRVGRHLLFSRIVLEFEGRPLHHRLYRDPSGQRLWVVVPADTKPGLRPPSRLPWELKELKLSRSEETIGSRLGVKIPQGSRVRAFLLGGDSGGSYRLVVDVLRPAKGEDTARIEEIATLGEHPWRTLEDLPVLPGALSDREFQTARPAADSSSAWPPPPLLSIAPDLAPRAEVKPVIPALQPLPPARSLTLAGTSGGSPSGGNAVTEDTSLKRRFLEFPKVVVQDAVEAIKAPARWRRSDWFIMGAIAAGTSAAFAADQPLREFILDNQDGTAQDFFKAINYFGRTETQLGVIGTFLAVGKLTNAPRLMDTGMLGLEALLFSAAVVLPLKATIGRERPNATDDAFEFSPFSLDNNAFPSGDTATAFALGTVIASQYESLWVSGTAYSVATLVGASRIYRNKHWLSDVVGGAAIGHLIGRFVVKMYKLRKGRKGTNSGLPRLHLNPMLAPETQGLAVSLRFNS
ncbi:MAG: phosphatase PAP2 family protein [Nitrospinota bacterium]